MLSLSNDLTIPRITPALLTPFSLVTL